MNTQLRDIYPESEELFDVVLMTNNHAYVGLRLINTINHHSMLWIAIWLDYVFVLFVADHFRLYGGETENGRALKVRRSSRGRDWKTWRASL